MLQGSDFPDAAAFLATALPWPVEGETFYVNIHGRTPNFDPATKEQRKDKEGKLLWQIGGGAFTTIAQAANRVAWYNQMNGQGTDVYVCMSGQATANERLNKAGRPTLGAVRSLENSVRFKGLWLDVDVKEGGKGYASSEEAASEFGRIRRAVGLPEATFIVWSGSGGFHAHWCFAETITPAQWEPLAHALVAAITEHGFRGDTGCTIDASRLLRVPQTWNYKRVLAGTGEKTPVKFFTRSGNTYAYEFIERILHPWIGVTPSRLFKNADGLADLGLVPAHLRAVGAADDLSANIDDQRSRPVSMAMLADVCPFIKRTLLTGGKDNNNALWQNTTNIALASSDGEQAAHWMAAGHDDYTELGTQEMIERQKVTKERKNMGWVKCATLAAQGAPECQSCPHLAQAQSPFNHVVHPLPPGTVLPGQVNGYHPPLPPGYSYGPNDIVLANVADEDGKITYEPVTTFPMLNPWMQDQPAVMNFSTVVAGKAGTSDVSIRQIKLPIGLLHDKSQMAKMLAEQHMFIQPNMIPRFGTFMGSWIEKLKETRSNVIQSAPFGWYRVNGEIAGFIYGGKCWMPNGTRQASSPDPMLERQYAPNGTLEPWLAASKMITDQDRPDINAMLACSFAAPLVTFVGQTGLLMSTYSPESGIGKSTVMRIAMAVWAHPIRSVQSLNDTQNSVLKKIGDIKNLPMYWDELKTEEDTKRFVNLAFQLAQGKEKSRMAADTSYREVGTWETILCSTSNDSLLNHIANQTRTTSAGIARIFEFCVRPGTKGQISAATAQQITAAVKENYGHAGLRYAQFLGENFDMVRKDVDELLHNLEHRYDMTAEERFWSALITCVLCGARYANHLGLTDINLSGLFDFMIHEFRGMRAERKDAPVDITNINTLTGHIARFLNQKRTWNTIFTDIIWASGARPPAAGTPGAVHLQSDPTKRLDELQVQLATTTNTCRIVKAAFTEWCITQQLSPRIILQKLKTDYGVVETRGKLGAGTSYATHTELVLDFDFKQPVWAGIFD